MWLAHIVAVASFAIWAQPHSCDTETIDAMAWVESRGNTFAVGGSGERGLLQVIPKWSVVPGLLLHVPAVGRMEGCRILQRWQRRAKGNKFLALQAYNGGNPGLKNECTKCTSYAKAVLRRKRHMRRARVHRRRY